MSDPAFEAALEAAIASTQRRALVMVGVGTVVAVAWYTASWVFARSLYALVPVAFVLGLSWWGALTGKAPGLKQLKGLRGGVVPAWFASPTHGLVAITDMAVAGGKGLYGSFHPASRSRVGSASYDEDAHTLIVLLRGTTGGAGDSEPVSRHVVSMGPAVTKERGFELSKLINQSVAGTRA